MNLGGRLRGSGSTLASICAIVALVTGVGLGTVAYIAAQGTTGIQAGLAERAGADLAVRASLALGPNADEQDAQVRAAIDSTFAGTAVPVSVTRTLESHVTIRAIEETTDSEGEGIPNTVDESGFALSLADFAERAVMVTGSEPTVPTEVAVLAAAAERLGLELGDEVLVDGVGFEVVGTWRAKDFLDPRWYGDPIIVDGGDDELGPFVITEQAWGRLDRNPDAVWTVVPDVRLIDSQNIAAVADAWGRIKTDWRGQVDELKTLAFQNRLVQSLRELQTRLDGLRAVEPVVFTLMGAAALVGVVELARLLGVIRARDTLLYWARGRSEGAIARQAALDIALAGALGAALGAAVVSLALALTGAGTVSWSSPGGWMPALIVTVAGALFAAVHATRAGVPARDRVARRSRAGLAIPGIVVIAVVAAGLCVWQLRLYGSPLTPTTTGVASLDPVAVLAPATALVALVLVLLLVFPAIARANERRVRRARVVSQLAARGLTRRLALVVAPLVLVTLAAGTSTIAAAYSATWSAAFTQTVQLRVGSDVHVGSRVEGLPTASLDAVAHAPGVTLAAPLEMQPLSLGGPSGTIVGIAPDALAELATAVPGTFDPVSAAQAIRYDISAPVLADDATDVTVDLTLTGVTLPPDLGIYVSDAAGFVRAVPLQRLPVLGPGGEVRYTTNDLPTPFAAPWRLVAVDFRFDFQSYGETPAEVTLDAVSTSGPSGDAQVDLAQYWVTDSWNIIAPPPSTNASGTGFEMTDYTAAARMTPTLSGDPIDSAKPPVIVSQLLAERYDVEVGDFLAFTLQDGVERQNFPVVGIVPVVPGATLETALLVDLGVIQHYQLRSTPIPAGPRDMWVTAEDPDGVAAALRALVPANARIESNGDPAGRAVLGSAATSLWGAAGCIILLALIGVVAAARARVRAGRNEVAVLRAIGLSSREQAGVVTRELGLTLVVGVAGGIVIGLIVAVLTIPFFARAAISSPYFALSTPLAVDGLGLAVLTAVLGAGLVAILVGVGARVASMVRTARPNEEGEA